MSKSIFKLFIFLFALLILQPANAADKVTVLLDWFLNPSHAPLFVAIEKGYFKEQGLDVTLIGPADPSDPPKLVAAKKADIAITYEPQFMIQTDRGLPLARIGSLIDHPLNCLAVLKHGPIHSIKDLRGKRIGHSTGEINSVILKTMLDNNDLQLADVELINIHYNLSQALVSKRVDAVTGMMRTFEVIQMDLINHPVTVFYPENNGVPRYDELLFIVNKDTIDNPKWGRFLKAVKQGNAYLQEHPQEMWLAFAKSHPEINNELNKRAWMATLPYFAKSPEDFNKRQWAIFEEFMIKNNLIKAKPNTTKNNL